METSTSDQQRLSSKPVQESHLDLLKRGTLSDVTFIVGLTKERIPCHQAFLVARSHVFEVMFSERWNGVKNKEIPIKNVAPTIFKKFLKFIYADTIVANAPEALELLQVAHLYDVKLLVSRCEELLMDNEVPLNDALDLFQAARKYEKLQLMDKAVDSMAKWLPELQSHPSFSRIDKGTLIYLLKRNCLNMAEVDLFRLALKWANNQTDLTLEQSLEGILPLIRFPVMTLEEFTTTVVPTGLLSQSTLVQIFTYFGTDAETRESMASTLKFNTQRRRLIGSIHYIDLYSGDLARKKTKRVYLLEFSDCLQISTQITSTKAVGIDGISVYCPALARTAFGPSSSTFMKFTLLLDHLEIGRVKGGPTYKNLLTMSPIKVEEGKLTEIKFDSFIPLENNAHYRITFEKTPQTRNGLVVPRGGYYVDAKVFGQMRNSKLTLKGSNTSVVIELKTKNGPPDLRDNFNFHMICRLSLEEL